MQPIFVARSGFDDPMANEFISVWTASSPSQRTAHPVIPRQDDWQDEFNRLMTSTAGFVFIVSRNFLGSAHCMWEYGWVRNRRVPCVGVVVDTYLIDALAASRIVMLTDLSNSDLDEIAALFEPSRNL